MTGEDQVPEPIHYAGHGTAARASTTGARTMGAPLRGIAVRVGLVATLVALSVGAPPVGGFPVQAAAAIPGTPADPVVVFQETFENGLSATGNIPLTSYVGVGGQTYTGTPYWTAPTMCNGIIIRNNSGPPPGCGGTAALHIRQMANALGRLNGTPVPTDNHAVSAYTNAPTTAFPLAAGDIEFATEDPISVPGGSRFLTFSVNATAINCFSNDPILRFALVDEGSEIPATNVPINVCTDPAGSNINVNGSNYRTGTFTTDGSVLFDGTELGIVMRNDMGSASGNDHAYDDITVLDATPQLDKSFGTMNPVTGTARLTFTVTNTSELATKMGWSGTDSLPAGLVVAADPAGSTTCTNGELSASAGASVVSFTGDLAGDLQQLTSCTFSLNVVPEIPTAQGSAPQVFQNCAANITSSVGLNLPDSCATVSFPPVAQLDITKSTSATSETREGDTVWYTVTATNTGGSDYTAADPAVVLDDMTGLLDDASYNGDAGSTRPGALSFTAPQLNWSGALSVGHSVTLTYSVTATLSGDGSLLNSACVPQGQSDGPPCATTSTVVPIAPSIDLTKSASPSDPASFTVGREITYTFVVTNSGNLRLDDPAVAEVAFDGAAAMSPISCPATPSLAPGGQMICTATYTLQQSDIDDHSLADPLINEAVATATASNNAAVTSPVRSAALPVLQSPALTIDKSVRPPAPTAAGHPVTFEFLLTNTGNVALTDAMVEEVSFTGTGTLSDVACPAAAATLAPGARATCTASYTLTQADVDAGSITNVAIGRATPPSGDPISSTPDDAVVSVEPAPSIAMVKSATPVVFTHAGEQVEYSFEVTNTGNVTLSSISINETDFSGTGGLAAPSCVPTTIAPTQTATCTVTYTLTQADVDAGIVTNSATAVGTPPVGATVESAVSSAVITVDPSASMSLAKSVDRTVVAGVGVELTYRFTINNTGQATLNNVAIREIAFSGSGDLSAIDCPAGPVAPGASVDCTATYSTTSDDVTAGSIVNTALATAQGPGGVEVASDPSSATVTVNPFTAALAASGGTFSWLLLLWPVGLVAVGVLLAGARMRRSAG